MIAEPLDFSPEAVARLQTVGEVTLRVCDRNELRAAFQEFEVVWFRLAHRIDGTFFSPNIKMRCRVLATPVTGLDHIDLSLCAANGVKVVSLRGEYEFLKTIRATAELTIGLTLALTRKIVPAASDVERGHWNRDEFRGSELFGKTVGLVGVGRLGTIVARYFRAFEMNVIGYDPRPDFPQEVAERVGSLEELLERSDVVSLHVNYNEQTRHLMGADQFARMKPSAVLINTSRGGVVDEGAMLSSLDSGRLAGVALDVLEGEPDIGADHPVIAYAKTHDNVLISPHIGGNTRESFARTELFLAERVLETLKTN